MKLAIVTEALADYVSGGILCIVSVLNELKKEGHDVCAFVKSPPYRSDWLPADFPIYPIGSNIWEEYDGILIASFSPIAKDVAEHKKSQDRFYWCHTLEDKFSYNGPEWQQQATDSYKLPLKIFCTSHYVRIMMEMQYGRRVIGTLVPPGVDSSVFHDGGRTLNYFDPYGMVLEADQPRINVCIFNRAGRIRGNDVASEAIKIAAGNGVRMRIITIPDGIRDRKQVAAYYRQSDIFIDASRLAGSPTPPKEAMSCGCIAICTPYGATDFILDEWNGYIVPVDDSEAIASRLFNYYYLPSQTKEMLHNNAANTIYQNYNWSAISAYFKWAIEEGLRRSDLLLPKEW